MDRVQKNLKSEVLFDLEHVIQCATYIKAKIIPTHSMITAPVQRRRIKVPWFKWANEECPGVGLCETTTKNRRLINNEDMAPPCSGKGVSVPFWNKTWQN